jgi:hypothetical protein
MKVTNQQKMLFGVLAIAVGFLGYDQLHAAPGAAADEPLAIEHKATAPAAAPTVTEAAATTLAERLEQFRGQHCEVRDAFASPLIIETAAVPAVDTAAFQHSHKLTGVFMSDNKPMAMINGTALTTGQAIDGFTLVGVGRKAVVLQAGDAKVELALR